MRKLWLKDVYDNLGWRKTLLINLVLDQLHIFVRAQRDRLDEGFLEASGREVQVFVNTRYRSIIQNTSILVL